jgi:hypothetical protein
MMLLAGADAMVSVSEPVAAEPAMLAFNVSFADKGEADEAQPLSWYVKLAVPFVVVAELGTKVAVPEAIHADVMDTVTGVPGVVPESVTCTLVCP